MLTRPPRRPPPPPSRTQSRVTVTWAVPGTGSAAVAWVARRTTLYPPSRPLAMRLASQPPRGAPGWWGKGGRGSRKELSSSIGRSVAEASRAGHNAERTQPLAPKPHKNPPSAVRPNCHAVRHLLFCGHWPGGPVAAATVATVKPAASHQSPTRSEQTAVGPCCRRQPRVAPLRGPQTGGSGGKASSSAAADAAPA